MANAKEPLNPVMLTCPATGKDAMTHLIVADAICAAFPNLRIDAIVAEGFSGREPWPEVAERLSRLEADAAAGKAPASGRRSAHRLLARGVPCVRHEPEAGAPEH